jgi:hypothetical protein
MVRRGSAQKSCVRAYTLVCESRQRREAGPMNTLQSIKTDVKSRFGGATPPWALRRIFEMGSNYS